MKFTDEDELPIQTDEIASFDPLSEESETISDSTPDFVIREDLDSDMHVAVKKSHAEQSGGVAGMPHQKNVKEKKIYERKASESLYSEELEFHQFRKKKMQDLDKKSKHLLLFSNINQLNFVDVNQNETVKAWAVLFHFRSKTFDSIIYDEFESITMRNAIGKSKGHELFSKFYLKLIEASYDKGFRMHLTTKCEKTGWPIDISLNTAGQSPMDAGTNFSQQRKKLALYFFLQEEVCLNAREQAEEPLGLQKLMLKHLQNISDFKVEYVTENDFYMNKDTIEGFVEYLLNEKLLNN